MNHVLQPASKSPSAPPLSEKNRLSVRNCRMRRPRLAPTDMRTATSLARAVPRTSRRLATLTQETSSTRPTMPMSTLSGVE